MKPEWNLDLAKSTLVSIAQPDWTAEVAKEISELETRITKRLLKSSLTLESQETLSLIQSIDQKLDSAQALAGLLELSKGSYALPPTINELTRRFILCVETIREHLNYNVEILTSPLLEWYRSLAPALIDNSLANEFQAIANNYLNGIDPGQLLLRRIKMDTKNQALQYRLREQNCSTTPLFTEQHQDESQEYWSKLISNAGYRQVSLSQARTIESRCYSQASWSVEQALDILCYALEEFHPKARTEIQALKDEGRLHVAQVDWNDDLCLDTSIGSFVHVYFDGGIEGLLRLAHEVGHAIQQSAFRELPYCTPALSSLDSEVWAIRAERLLLDYLELHQETADAARSLRASRSLELNHRHRMLHSFELELHSTSLVSKQQVNNLWLEKNRSFYGDRVTLDKGFQDAWADIHHLFTAPYYLMIYPMAYNQEALLQPLPGLE